MEITKIIRNGRKKILIIMHETGVDKRDEAVTILLRDRYDVIY